MQGNQHSSHKPKSSLLMLLMMLMLVITAVAVTITITKPLTVYATPEDGYNGGQSEDSNKVGTGTIGASTTNTAFYMYIVDSKGYALTPGILIYNTNSGIKKNWGKIKEFNYLTKQSSGILSAPISLADGASIRAEFSDAPSPILFENDKWVSNGDKVRQWLMYKNSITNEYRFYAILVLFGKLSASTIFTLNAAIFRAV